MSEKTVLKKKGVSERETDTAAGALPAYVRGIDAESLYFFLTLYRAGSLPRAAEQMGVSLSSANRMLAKLRTYWNDPLFTRSGFLMQPTESAKKRYARVLGLMNTLEDLQHEDRIDPLHLKRTVRLATYDNAFTLGIASVFSEFEKRLPLVRFHVTQADEHLFESAGSRFLRAPGTAPAAPLHSARHGTLCLRCAEGASINKKGCEIREP